MVYKCINGHVDFYEPCDYEEDTKICYRCENEIEMIQVIDPEELMEIAESIGDKEYWHIAADEAIYQRLLQLDYEFAQRYKKVRDDGGGFYYM